MTALKRGRYAAADVYYPATGGARAALVVAVIWGIVGAVLYSSGRKKLREVNPTPERTVDTLKNVPDALKGEAGGHR